MVLQLFFKEYEKTCCSNILDYRKMLNKLKNSSVSQFSSNSFKTKFPTHPYDEQADNILVAGNALLTLLRANVLKLNLDGPGNKIIEHCPKVI